MKKYISFIVLIFFAENIFSQTINDKSNLNSLINQNLISVTIGGDFIVNGSYPASIIERVDQFITRIYNEAREELMSRVVQQPFLMEKIQKEIESYSLRNVILKRSNGEELTLDLLKFRRTGDFSHNPYLKNDDVIIFPPSDLERNFISVSGAVNKPGKYHYREGDKLSDAIELAQGLNKAYINITTAEINRLSYDGERIEVIKVNIDEDFPLERGDRIIITADVNQKKEYTVTVIGEVKYPGEIPITKTSTTIKDVIEKAGGLTEYASLKNARLFSGNTLPILIKRFYDVEMELQPDFIMDQVTEISDMLIQLENAMMFRMSNITIEDSVYFFMENELRLLTQGTSIDLTKINSSDSEASKQTVRDGDFIIIPQRKKTVYVFGQVANPGNIAFEEGKNVFYYIDQAGGMGEYAEDEDEIMIIKGEGREWISPADHPVAIEEGDFIYVPRVPNRTFSYYIQTAATYLSVVASTATIILLLLQLNPNNR